MSKKYTIGIDFGTQSGRAVVVELGTAREMAAAVEVYSHAVMDERLPSGRTLPPDWALEHPQDYLDVLLRAVPAAVSASGVDPGDIIGIGIDFTSCTLIGVDREGTPLCFLPEWEDDPHSYVKLWKHHAAQNEANEMTEVARQRGETFLARYGGKVSSEWMFPKILQVIREDPAYYDACHCFMEAADWIILQMTGAWTRNAGSVGYKAFYSKRDGYPDRAYFAAVDPRMENIVEEKLGGTVMPLGAKAGTLTADMAEKMGLVPGIAVAVANVDAHVTVPAVGITGPGELLMIMGTSTCHILVGAEAKNVPGMCGVVEDGVLPGWPGYEAGQSCVGDHFEWFVENCLPASYERAAEKAGMGVHAYLTELAGRLAIGESGLLALDWWNGNRSVLVDADLTGMLLGCTLLTRPEEVYRALIEATAYGTRMIIDNFAENGVPVDALYAAGGIAQKNELMMQIYADVTGREIRIAASPQAPAVGSAMHAAVAAGKEMGGYADIVEAAREMGRVTERVYRPVAENVVRYEALYREYRVLHDTFGRGGNDVMKRLKAIREEAIAHR